MTQLNNREASSTQNPHGAGTPIPATRGRVAPCGFNVEAARQEIESPYAMTDPREMVLAACDEIERLREALREIAEPGPTLPRAIARAVLEGHS